MYNSHLVEHKLLQTSDREDVIISNPIHSRVTKLTTRELAVVVKSNLEQYLFYIYDNLLNLDLVAMKEYVSSSSEDEIALAINTPYNLNLELIEAAQYLVSEVEVLVALISVLDLKTDNLTEEEDNLIYSNIFKLLSYLQHFSSGFDYYNHQIDEDDVLCLLLKSVIDFYYQLIASIEAYVGGDLDELMQMAQETSLFNLYYLRNLYEVIGLKHIASKEVSQLPLVDVELTRQWDIYRTVSYKNEKTGTKLKVPELKKNIDVIQESARKQANKLFKELF